ncbi:phosphoribosylformylglycinamidine synthase subunit PurL [Edaphobacter albus]|uniref:phosphoribosylformylglycinamidine synthase subunit PurL n=1 Tax=Edaphobacter sp. 4G125 TaxID=2763071 RepID=UPI0016441597|nr:phosphoribosylformylglycinamidine synthase subunit PurL [Edaphobacter sp. 4G125]QNI36729.1 phosphoribosylformylglycinamidine synthase subunit PurL [Edaphobacter sp. 4G125]
MAHLQAEQPLTVPSPATITPELLKQHSITPDEYKRIEAALGRTPSLTELGIFSVMWSEHCSYKSSRVHLKRLPTKGDRTSGPGSVVQGPGENAGIIDVGDGWACAFKIESHNHPSYIEPYQGAATGVGGILRDIFTMNARPLAVMDSLRFGPLDETEPDEALRVKNHQVVTGVVHGIAGYGNCFGVPNLGGETRFEPCYSGNPLVNAFALGLVKKDEIFYAKAVGVGNPVIYVGAKTGRDGIHGATMASEEFTEGSEQKRPNVQMGDPFMEKLLLEACIEAMATGAVLGIQDMGAAGLTCSTCEMGARGGLGLTVELDRVPQRETGMTSYEIMLSESQERMLLVADKNRAVEVLDVFSKWGLDASIVGEVTAEPKMRITQGGVLMADIPNVSLTDDAPVYHRPVGTWNPPVPKDPPAHVLEELKKPRDYTADLKKLLASANICDKRWVYEQYDSMVQTNTVQGPGGEAGVMRIKGTGTKGTSLSPMDDREQAHALRERGLAMALAGNGRWAYLDPKLGAMHAVAEAARKVACTGATPVSATNCLNFGNPEKPEIMAQLSNAIDGMSEACKALGTPITGGNVSLYNETKGVGIYPTPVVGIVGIIDDVTKAVPANFRKAGDTVLFLSALTGKDRNAKQDMGATDFAKTVLGELWGAPPVLHLEEEVALQKALIALADKGLLKSAGDLSDGGCATAFAKGGFPRNLGVKIVMKMESDDSFLLTERLFSEVGSSVIATVDPANLDEIQTVLKDVGRVWAFPIGEVTSGKYTVEINGKMLIDTSIAELKAAWSGALESQIADELVTA